MNTDTKRHIDAARQVLVGVVPNPTSQIDQITNALIYKFMDDMDQSAIKQGDEPSFFVGDLEPYAWTRLMDPRMGNQERMNLYGEALIKFSQAKQLPELFRGIFKSAFLPYRSPETLGLFLKEIDYFDYSHPEELGNAYEYLLSIMSSQGDAGQFRTPRHIIDFIVDVINPTKDDKVLDPACGTGGFLVSSYKHILEQHDGKNDPKKKEKPLTPDERKKLMANFEGYDIDPTMVRIAQVNMYLHQFKNPKIFQYDSLSSDERWNDKFDVILANPPFMSPKGGIKPHSKFSIQSSRSEVLFVDYIMNHLRPKGRAGIIVPEGIIFQSGTAHKQLRKNLVEDGLYAVVSLPSGVFAPYSGVKTSILLFNNELAKTSQEILFVKIENDGFDLGATKRPISKNDLPTALEILNRWRTGEKIENKLAVYAEKTKIAENGDYNLSGDRYRVTTDYTNARWPQVRLKDVAVIDWGNTSITKKEYVENGSHLAVSAAGCDGRMDKYEHEVGVTVLSAIGANCGVVFYPTEKFIAIKNTMTFTPDRTKLNPKYLYLIMKENSLPRRGGGQPFMAKADVEEYQIPLPPLEIQEQVVEQIDGYQKIIDGVSQAVSAWKPRIEIDPEWEKVKIGDVCIIGDGNHSSKYPRSDEMVSSGVPFIRGINMVDGKIIDDNLIYISAEKHQQLKKGHLKTGDILFSNRGEIGKVAYVDERFDGANLNSQLAWLRSKEKLNSWYLLWILMSDYTQQQLAVLKQGATLQQFTIKQLSAFEIPLPPLEIQKQIVEKIEFERSGIEKAKELLPTFRQHIKNTIAKLWSE
jgi:type I restriction enzyme M protein